MSDALTVHILGAVRVRRDGRWHEVAAAKERAVLAALALRPGRVVSLDDLVLVLWDDNPPPTAAKTAQNYVARLRRELPDGMLWTQAPGYILRVDADAVDAKRFESLVEKGRAALDGGRVAEARHLLEEAEGLWEGEPLADVPATPGIDAAAAWLAELHRLADEALADADVRLGHAADAAARLESLVREEPLRERRWELLMLALYRSGRQADALDAFQRARTTLVEHLGVEPGDSLRDLEYRVLRHDPSLDMAASEVMPAGEVTFLFTHVEASTRDRDQHTAAMPVAPERHQSLVRAAVEGNGGVVVRETGAPLVAAFATANDAIRAAIDAQQRLRETDRFDAGPLRARMGLHTGVAYPEGDDYHGAAVDRCARIVGVAHRGQVIVSETTHACVEPGLDGVTFLDLGSHRLRDRLPATRLFQVVHAALPTRFPPVASLDVVPNNLPASTSSFVGRERALDDVGDALDRSRLVTLTGAGGIGKSRLALQAAAERSDSHPDGVWLVALDAVASPDLIAHEVASTLSLVELPGRTWTDSVCELLRHRHALLVLDNCDHVLDGVAVFVAQLLPSCPDVRVLATSREPLHLTGEVTWRVPPMDLAAGHPATEMCESSRLFLERARDVEAAFRPSREILDGIDDICARLDGMPLAIELAAARVRVLSVPEIRDRLDDRFRLLSGGVRSAPARQRTLEATVAWSYDLCDTREQRFFDHLSVFPATFSLDAAGAVGGMEADDALELLTTLVDRSLVLHDPGGEHGSYRLLETMRAYGHDRLVRAEAESGARDRHLGWVVRFAGQAAAGLDGHDQLPWLDRVSSEMHDVGAALEWAAKVAPVTGLGIVDDLGRYWKIRAIREGESWAGRLLNAAGAVDPAVEARARFILGGLALFAGDPALAEQNLTNAAKLARAIGDRSTLAWSLNYLAQCRAPTALSDAVALAEEGADIFDELDDPRGQSLSETTLSMLALATGDVDGFAAHNLTNEQYMPQLRTPYDLAHVAEGVGIRRMIIDRDWPRATDAARYALEQYRDLRNTLCAVHGLLTVAGLAILAGNTQRAVVLLGAANGLQEGAGILASVKPNPSLVEAARTALGEAAFAAARASGAALDFDAALALALDTIAPGTTRSSPPPKGWSTAPERMQDSGEAGVGHQREVD